MMETNNGEKKETKEVYEAPAMEIVEIKVELGFLMSGESASAASYDPLKELIN